MYKRQIFDLADKTREKLEADFSNLFADYVNEHSGVLKMFTHIKENQLFYKTYFKLCYDDKHLVSIYDTKRVEKEHIASNLKYYICLLYTSKPAFPILTFSIFPIRMI